MPLAEQDVTLWSAALAGEAEDELAAAAGLGRVGRFQLEAAIQSVASQRAVTGETEWEAAALLYEGLVRIAPTIGALVGRAAAVAEARGAGPASTCSAELPPDPLASYQPYWALSGASAGAAGARGRGGAGLSIARSA